MKRPVLMVSPIPSHPQFQGNSARVFRMGQLMQLAGYPVHFVYYGLEGLTSQERIAHEACWDEFHYIQPEAGVSTPSMGDYYHIDDWYDHRVSELVGRLTECWDYVACLVHYVWFSKVLESVPSRVIKIIDTHDVFGDRHRIAREAGLEPVWFYTSPALEAEGLARADVVLAIQDEEASYFRSITTKQVMSVGYVCPEHWLPAPATHIKKKVGYLGSGNPFNVASISSFEEAVLMCPVLLSYYEFHLAGAICRSFDVPDAQVFKCWGVVNNVTDFYQDMDLLINPMVGGTGLKIKSVEVMAYRRPLLATQDAMVGICSSSEPSVFKTPLDIVQTLVRSIKSDDLPQLGIVPNVWEQYQGRTYRQFNQLLDLLKRADAA